jgi:hypothetical protein
MTTILSPGTAGTGLIPKITPLQPVGSVDLRINAGGLTRRVYNQILVSRYETDQGSVSRSNPHRLAHCGGVAHE